jgi:phosphoserine phosphatase RsbU/P
LAERKKYVNLTSGFITLLLVDVMLQWFGKLRALTILITIALVVMGSILAFRIFRRTVRQTIWRLRNRLYVTYLFIAVVPIVLTIALAAVGTWIVSGQIGVYLVTSQLERRAADLENPVRLLSEAKAADRVALMQGLAPLMQDRTPGFEVLVSGDQPLRFPPESKLELPAQPLPYTGFVVRDGRYYGISIARRGKTVAMATAPIERNLLARVLNGIGQVEFNQTEIAGKLPVAVNFLDFEVPYFGRLKSVVWEDFTRPRDGVLVIRTRPSAVLDALYGNQTDDAQIALLIFVVIAGLLLVVVVLSVVIGASLTGTITGAVHSLYEGTQRISKGDFAYRIPVKGKDQLAELSTSFNEMTTRLQSLIVVEKEKERLQSELEIASEVQNQLFPHSAPKLKTIELIGTCQPARMVSGDYYDYLCLPDGNLAVAIGDVAGKGISAALLMASIQSIMRTQLAAGLPVSVAAGVAHSQPHFCTAGVVAQLNRQLYASTSPEKYATFFFGVYDENTRMLTYTNAGHLQPLLLHKGQATLLDVTGTVVGAFPAVTYEEQTVKIEAGDLLVAYTDGITEPENEYGEEFGEARLIEVALRHQNLEPKQIAGRIMEAVQLWSKAPELPDDMTVVIARGLT